MKPDIHPAYGRVVFRDRSTGDVVVTRSTLVRRPGDGTVEVDGVGCPVVDVDVSRHSHPFWTGTARTVDGEGRVQRFRRRFGRTA